MSYHTHCTNLDAEVGTISLLNSPLTFSQQKSASSATGLNRFTDELVNFLLLIHPLARSLGPANGFRRELMSMRVHSRDSVLSNIPQFIVLIIGSLLPDHWCYRSPVKRKRVSLPARSRAYFINFSMRAAQDIPSSLSRKYISQNNEKNIGHLATVAFNGSTTCVRVDSSRLLSRRRPQYADIKLVLPALERNKVSQGASFPSKSNFQAGAVNFKIAEREDGERRDWNLHLFLRGGNRLRVARTRERASERALLVATRSGKLIKLKDFKSLHLSSSLDTVLLRIVRLDLPHIFARIHQSLQTLLRCSRRRMARESR